MERRTAFRPDGRAGRVTSARGIGDFGISLTLLAIVTLGMGLWITATEVLRPWGLGFFQSSIAPSTPSWAPTWIASAPARASLAANVGVIRGELWAQDALLTSGLNFDARPAAIPNADALAAGHAAAEHALSLAPIDPRMWLYLAASEAAAPDAMPDIASASSGDTSPLQMAYLTGQEIRELVPMRLMIAARSNALANKDVQDFVRADIDLATKRFPDLKAAVMRAYQASTPANHLFFEIAIKANDPTLLSQP